MSSVEYAAPPGCELGDRRAWHLANPALRAGLLHVDALESELLLVPEADFRSYRLGQWVDAVVAELVTARYVGGMSDGVAPPDGTELVLGLAGTWSSSVAVVGATLDGELHVLYASDTATDDELEGVFSEAAARWTVVEVVVAPRTRGNLVATLRDAGADGRPALEVEVWPATTEAEVVSATDWRRAIVEGRVAHDHHPLLGEHVASSVARNTPDGSLRLVPPEDGRPVDSGTCGADGMDSSS